MFICFSHNLHKIPILLITLFLCLNVSLTFNHIHELLLMNTMKKIPCGNDVFNVESIYHILQNIYTYIPPLCITHYIHKNSKDEEKRKLKKNKKKYFIKNLLQIKK